MAEPTTTTTSVAWALAAGTLGAFFAAIGISGAVAFWGLLGSLFGVSFAPSAGRFRSMAMFPASALVAAKFGTMASAQWFGGSGDYAGGLAVISGIMLHPAISAGVKLLPELGARMIGRTPQNQEPK